jgi:hypothetical protein
MSALGLDVIASVRMRLALVLVAVVVIVVAHNFLLLYFAGRIPVAA